jgi:hypothetical protein
MKSNKLLYTVQSLRDSTIVKTLWAKDWEEVQSKVGYYYAIAYVQKYSDKLLHFDEYIIYTTRSEFKYKVEEEVRYNGTMYRIQQRIIGNHGSRLYKAFHPGPQVMVENQIR